MAKTLARTYNCPTEFALNVLGGKWKTVILAYLKERPCSYGDLRRLVPKLTDKMLTERLSDLTKSGLVKKEANPRKRNSEVYILTARGTSLMPVLAELYAWGVTHATSFGVVVGEPLAKLRQGEAVKRTEVV